MHNEIEHRAFNELRAEGDNVLDRASWCPTIAPSARSENASPSDGVAGSIGTIGPEVRCNLHHRSRIADCPTQGERRADRSLTRRPELRARIEVAPTANGCDCLELDPQEDPHQDYRQNFAA